MKKIYTFLFNFSALILIEMLFGLIAFDTYTRSSIIFMFFYLLVMALLNTIIFSLFNKKVNFILGCVIYSILGLYFSIQIVFKQVFDTFFQVALFSLSDQLLSFGKETIISIISNIHYIILSFVPLVLFILLRKKIDLNRFKVKDIIIFVSSFIISIVGLFIYINLIQKDTIIYKLIYKMNDNSQNVQRLGVLQSAILDVSKAIINFEEEIVINNEITTEVSDDEDIFDYEYNVLDIDFSKGNNSTLNEFMASDIGTKQNEYTGIFEGKNLVYIVAESFHTIGVSKELTPTLYNLINSGFKFENFYVPNNLSTIGGEFQAITGLYPENTILSTWRSGKNYFPYGLANKFKEYGYNTYAYHDNSYTFQDRYKYLKSQGFTNFKACRNGMEKLINCDAWPQSDLEMIDKTTSDYLDSDVPFLVYYMTVSGHFGYTKGGNSMVRKNYDLVKGLNYSENVKGYIATQIELDRALELLIKRLEEKEILDDTVIVLLADHYPYDLSISEVNEVSTYERDNVIEVNHNNLIIWNSKIKSKKIEKVSMSIDVLPTVYNLFGISYDSRLLMGKDIFSNTEGLAIMKNRSWVTNKGTYYSITNTFIPSDQMINDNYVEEINKIVNNRLNISKMIISNNYYNSIFK
ncbi:MAG: sulfatase-like hydrolase/transferase [Bacilli bacterium]|nr:sulfatase-like hydrolase/transferase [Bacilli bacterium]